MKRFRTYLFSNILFCSVFLFSLSSLAQSDNSLKLLTLNFNAETANKILRTKRLDVIESYAKSENLDVIFIQECWDYENFKTIGIKLSQDLNMDVAYNFEDGLAGVRVTSLVILTKKDLKLRKIKRIKLPHSAPTMGNGQTTWAGLGEVDMLIGGAITLRNGQEAFIWTSHMNDASSENRQAQAKFALTQMQNLATAEGFAWDQAWVLFGGDFNSAPESAEQTYYRNVGHFQDSWQATHPGDPGHTLAGDVTDPEYNPMVHGAGLFPPQYAYQDSERIDYIYSHIPKTVGVQTTRVFTSPVNNVWMSDHFGLLGSFDFSSSSSLPTPSADSDFARKTETFIIDEKNVQELPSKLDFKTNAEGGFTLVNSLNAYVQFSFTTDKKDVYTLNHAGIAHGETVSFSFFATGDYKYRMIVSNYQRTPIDDPITIETDGIVHVH